MGAPVGGLGSQPVRLFSEVVEPFGCDSRHRSIGWSRVIDWHPRCLCFGFLTAM